MRLFVFLILSLIFFSQQSAVALMTIGGNMDGTGQAMGMQPCPYINTKGADYLESLADSYQDKIDDKSDEIQDIQEEMDELVAQTKDSYSYKKENLPFQPKVTQSLAAYIQSGYQCQSANTFFVDNNGQNIVKPCTQSIADINDGVCGDSQFYTNQTKLQTYINSCKTWTRRYAELNSKLAKKQNEIEKLEQKKEEASRKYEQAYEREERKRERAEERGIPYVEGSACVDCAMPEQQLQKSNKGLGTALFMDGVNLLGWYFGTKYVTDQNQKLGWATPPLALGLPGANATAGWYYNQRYGGGMGAGSWGCAPGMGYQTGPYGAGGPYGNISPYGSCGGAFGSPCMGNGYPMGYNPAMGGGIYGPGVGPGGMAGPWGGGGFYPNPYGMAGAGVGGMGSFGFGAGPGGQFGYGGNFNLFGGAGIPGVGGMFPGSLATGFNPGMYGMGGFPGAYTGGYGVSGGFGAGPGGSGSWYGPGGGMGFGGGYPGFGMGMGGYPGMGGGFGMGYPGMGMGGGFGGGYLGMGMGGYPGMGGGFGGGYPGMGMGGYPGMGGGFGGMGGPYQMQMMQIQMQQYQAYYQAQMRAMQNQQAATQQAYSLQMEMQQLQQRYYQLMGYINSGGMYGAGFGVGVGVGVGVGYPPPPGAPTSVGPPPQR